MTSVRVPGFAGRAVAVALATALLIACGGAGEPQPLREPRAVSGLTPELAPVVDGNNAFAWLLFEGLRHEEGNIFLSPFSVSAALGMMYAGARGQTADEMRLTMQIAVDDATFHHEFGALLRDLGGDHAGRGYELNIANRTFGQQDRDYLPEYRRLTREAYGAELAEVDFAGDSDGARNTINAWVAERTRNKIPELFEQGQIDAMTQLVVANAIYFKADWAERFDANETHDAPFTCSDGAQVAVKMMSKIGDFRGGWYEGLSVLELDYQDNEVGMVVLLPDANDGLDELEASLSRQRVDELIAELVELKVAVTIPRWETGYSVGLRDTLSALGMPSAFTPGLADFSGIIDQSEGSVPIHLGHVPHKAYVKVDERGTEAAAATGAEARITSGQPSFVADHPFVYLIRDRLTNSILFVGRVEDPTDPGKL